MSKPKQVTTQFCNWVFTQFNTPWGALTKDAIAMETIAQSMINALKETLKATEAQFQLEECPSTHRLHLQGYFRLPRCTFTSIQQRMTDVKCRFDNLASMRGTVGHSVTYTAKAETRVLGPWSFSNEPVIPSAEEAFGFLDRQVIVCVGPHKIGKTTIWNTIMQYCGYSVYNPPSKSANSNGAWIGPYAGEEAVIFDEWTPNDYPLSTWKKLLDVVPQTLPAQAGGKSIRWTPKVIIMLSNFSPFSTFLMDEAFEHRVTEVTFWNSLPRPNMRKRKILFDPRSAEFLDFLEKNPIKIQKVK